MADPDWLNINRNTGKPMSGAPKAGIDVTKQPGRGFGGVLPEKKVDLTKLLAGMGRGGSGGGGGGGGGGTNITALLADIEARRNAANARFKKNRADVTNMYGQLASAISGYRPTVEADYTSMGNNVQSRAADNAGLISGAIGDQADRRASSADVLGITPEQLAAGPEVGSTAVLNQALGNVANTAQNWGGYLQAEQGNELNRLDNSATAAKGTGAGFVDQLRVSLEDYLRGLDSEKAQLAGMGGGGGGGGGGYSGGGSLADRLSQLLAAGGGGGKSTGFAGQSGSGSGTGQMPLTGGTQKKGLNPDLWRLGIPGAKPPFF